jgi:hypothetical protein
MKTIKEEAVFRYPDAPDDSLYPAINQFRVNAERKAFEAGATFMCQSAISLAKNNFNFICEIIDDLKKNGYTEDGMAAVMLNDWRGELEEQTNEE